MAPLGGLQEVIHGVADAYMVGEAGLGDALARGMAYGRANIQTIVQLTGGTLTKALALHLAAVLPTVGHSINLDDQYEDDITTERIPVIEGSSPVPEAPGLGVEVDEAALERAAARQPTVLRRYVSVLRLPGGHTLYTPKFPAVSRLTGYEEGTIRGLRVELWRKTARRSLLASMSVSTARAWSPPMIPDTPAPTARRPLRVLCRR